MNAGKLSYRAAQVLALQPVLVGHLDCHYPVSVHSSLAIYPRVVVGRGKIWLSSLLSATETTGKRESQPGRHG